MRMVLKRELLLSGETVPLLASKVAYEQLRPASAAQFCPRCLADAAYHRLAWIPQAPQLGGWGVAACLEHRCLLLDRCPDCWQPVTIPDVAEAYCRRCGYELSHGPAPSIAEDAWGQFAQRVIQAWLDLAPRSAVAHRIPPPDQPPAVLYRVLDGLRWNLMGVRADWPYLHYLPPERSSADHGAFSPQAVTECYYEVTQAAQILAVVGLDVAGILKHVAQRELSGRLPEKSSGLREVLFHIPSLRPAPTA